jgi:dipeptidyl aminopeptidase/acylaminoacyl peptidase
LWTGKTLLIRPSAVYVIGGSFGGPAALLASQDKRVTKAVALAPVVDWTKDSKAEPFDLLMRFTKQAFGGAYRFSDRDFNKLKTGKFYQPMARADKIDGRKLLIIHAKDDRIVPYQPTALFAKRTGARLILESKGGHCGTSRLKDPKTLRTVLRFLRKNDK